MVKRQFVAAAIAVMVFQVSPSPAQVSNQTDAEGTRHVRISLGGALRKALGGKEAQQRTAASGSTQAFGAGVVSLVPIRTAIGARYLDGRFDLSCAARLIYSAKAGQPLDAQSRDDCRNHYLIDQSKLKMAGRDYDKQAPAFHTTENVATQTRYWEGIANEAVVELRAAQRFGTQFQSFAYLDPVTGRLNITPMIPKDASAEAAITLLPKQLPITLDDAAAEAKLKAEAVPDGGRFRQAGQVRCTLTLEHVQSTDHGPWHAARATVRHSEYVRYEVQMKVIASGCSTAAS